ncbi:AAA domain-containing protein [Lutibacter sp.]
MNEYKNILSCWHKLEHFSPSPLPKGKNISELNVEHWKTPLKHTKSDKTIEYTIYLGVFETSEVNKFIKKHFNDTAKNENFKNSKIYFASLNLDIEGKYINDTFGVSSLPWALGQLEKGNIKNDNWSIKFEEVKEVLINEIETIFNKVETTSENEIVAFSSIADKNQLLKLQQKIENLFGWSVKPNKSIYIKINKDKHIKAKSNAEILNSFYIKDLETILLNFDINKSPKAFSDYLKGSLNQKSDRTDLLKNINVLKDNLSPNNYPDGCWPSDYTLSLMQQYAVNNIFNNLSNSNQEGMFSVNGPPGTGKTTLLRDIIAPIIVKRAKELILIENPSDAFTKNGELKIKNSSYSPWLWSPNQSITNAGIVVASSNNGAVENISKELPLKEEVSPTYSNEIEYFKNVAEKCIHDNNWGIISAVLGNKQNRNNLVSSLWFNKEFKDLQQTLKDDKVYDNSDWENIVAKFNKKLKAVSDEKERLENFKDEYDEFLATKSLYHQLSIDLKKTIKQFILSKEKKDNQIALIKRLNENKSEVLNELSIIKSTKPNFFNYWFSKQKRDIYKKALRLTLNRYNDLLEKLIENNSILESFESAFIKLKTLKNKYETEFIETSKKLNLFQKKTQDAKDELKNNYADNSFWSNIETKESQEACPWYSSKLKKLQSELFIVSLKLNETFILNANSKSSRISTTLAGFFEYLKGNTTATSSEIKAMWNTFFLVIPVISSTFASIQTMFKDLGKEDIPWLFIDEAGQAIPQAAAGAIWRSKRVAVVGDPFQIEPVVTIPSVVTDNISNYFELNSNQVNSELSVQSMADRINPLGSYLNINGKKEWIGIPLRVHRRCLSPMFEISNRIAYDNTMYSSTKTPKKICINFETSFIHCEGKVEGRHFVKNQAEIIKDILINEISIIKKLPDIFIITPFSEISYQLNSYLFKYLINEINKYEDIDSKNMGDWLKSHIGTVHTFQGKQAEGVILCLGLDETTEGAASWASKKPNLLNVALTRAKYRFTAIGDKNIWLKQPYFNELKKLKQ